MKKLIGLTVALLLYCSSLYAANVCIRYGTTYNGDGTTWASATSAGGVGAKNVLTTPLTPGNTYYIADGESSSMVFIGDEYYTGSAYTYIKKATASVHGTDTGWLSSYGDGQMIFRGLVIEGPFIDIDGITGELDGSVVPYGFLVQCTAETVYVNGDVAAMWITRPHAPYGGEHLYIRHVEIALSPNGCADLDAANALGWEPTSAALKGARGLYTDINILHCYLKGASTNLHHNWSNSTISDNYFGENCSRSFSHGQQISALYAHYITLSNNIFVDTETFVIGAHQAEVVPTIASGCSNWYIYNNIVIGGTLSAVFAMAESGEYDGVTTWKVYNNTFVNVNCGARGAFFTGKLTDINSSKSYAYNNLFYNCTTPRMDNADSISKNTIVHDYNGYLKCTGTINSADETFPQRDDVATDPFTDSAGGDYSILVGTLPVENGISTDLFSTDFIGITRPQGAAWDIGAYEYVSGASYPKHQMGAGPTVQNGVGSTVQWFE